MLTNEQYRIEREICDKAESYARTCMAMRGPKCNYITAEEAADPIYAACNNEMRGRVELFELHRDKPEHFSAYSTVEDGCYSVTTWMGDSLGRVVFVGLWHRNNLGAKWRVLHVRADWGGVYSGREYKSRQLVNFRRLKQA